MANKQPVTPLSAHRLFPAVVAIWFAALFGLGCAVLPAAVIEGVVSSIGLPALIPAAAPPLGFTAQAMIAIAAALVGGFCGFVLARKLASAQGAVRPAHDPAYGEKSRRKRDKEGARRPLSIKDDLDDEPLFAASFVADEPLAGRRRSFLPMADQPAPEPEPEPEPEVEPEETFEHDFPVDAPFADEPEYAERVFADEPTADFQPQPEDVHYPEPEVAADPAVEPPVFDPVPAIEPEAAPAPVGILPSDPRADVGQMGIVQLTERLGHALHDRLDRGQLRPLAPPPALLAELAGLPPRPEVAEPEPAPAFVPEEEFPAADFAPSPFGLPDFPLDEIDPQEAIFGVADIDSVPPRSATFAPSMTEALRPAALQLDEFGEDEEEEDETEFAEEQYGSLLAIRGLPGETRDPFTEPDEDPGYENEIEDSRPFDGQPAQAQPAAPTETENAGTEDETEALRRALAQLQRMSGAA